MILLTQPELAAITGYKRARDQVAWVREKYGIVAHVNAANEAVVLRAHLEAARLPSKPSEKAVRKVR